jgi:hypothetical protein
MRSAAITDFMNTPVSVAGRPGVGRLRQWKTGGRNRSKLSALLRFAWVAMSSLAPEVSFFPVRSFARAWLSVLSQW